MPRFLVVLMILLAAGPLHGQEPGPARASLERFNHGLKRLHARFNQTVVAQDGELLEKGGGAIWMQRPNLFRWRYEGEFPELIVADGERVWIHDEALEQVTVREQTGLPGDSPLLLITDLSGLDRQFMVTELGDNQGMLLLELKVTSQDAEFERVLVGLRDDVLVLMALEDAFGMRTEIVFSEIDRNPDFGTSRFQFVPPPGIDIIGEAELIDP